MKVNRHIGPGEQHQGSLILLGCAQAGLTRAHLETVMCTFGGMA